MTIPSNVFLLELNFIFVFQPLVKSGDIWEFEGVNKFESIERDLQKQFDKNYSVTTDSMDGELRVAKVIFIVIQSV